MTATTAVAEEDGEMGKTNICHRLAVVKAGFEAVARYVGRFNNDGEMDAGNLQS
jgi:hypothetical protein